MAQGVMRLITKQGRPYFIMPHPTKLESVTMIVSSILHTVKTHSPQVKSCIQ